MSKKRRRPLRCIVCKARRYHVDDYSAPPQVQIKCPACRAETRFCKDYEDARLEWDAGNVD